MSWKSLARILTAALAAIVSGAMLLGSSAEEKRPESATIISTDTDRDAALVAAVKDGDSEKVRALLAAYKREGRRLPTHEYDGTLLHIAASHGSQAVLLLLLDAGLSPHVATSFGATPLHYAARSNQPRMVQLLLAAGADVNARTARGLTPLHLSNGTTQMLLDAGADPKARDDKGQTAIFNAGPDVRALVKAGLDVNARNNDGWTPLHLAALNAQMDHAKALLDHGADIEAKTPAEYVIRSEESWGTETRSIPAGYTAIDIASNEHDRVKWVTGRNRPMIDLLRARGTKRPALGIPFWRW
ncbi:MAG TPA: ankyrin repeat domain-containing protein [Alphaproteobacteria bacterium]|nr:ankyrin repeat domain-containing protein [Alphaproteobacteria bacterium]